MLVLVVRDDEAVTIGDNIKLIVERRGCYTKLVFDAPKEIEIKRLPQSKIDERIVSFAQGTRRWIR